MPGLISHGGGSLIERAGGGSTTGLGRIVRGSFTSSTVTILNNNPAGNATGAISSGTLTITHNFGETSPYLVLWELSDNSNNLIVPTAGNVTYNTNSVVFNLSFVGTISGTWQFVVVG